MTVLSLRYHPSARARIPATAALACATLFVLVGCSTGSDTGSRAVPTSPAVSPSMSCAEVKAVMDRLDAKLYVKPRDLALLKEGDALALDHPACFTPYLVAGARNLKKDLDKGIVPTPPAIP